MTDLKELNQLKSDFYLPVRAQSSMSSDENFSHFKFHLD